MAKKNSISNSKETATPPLSPPVNFSIADRQTDLKEWEAIAKGSIEGNLYARNSSNSSAIAFEKEIQHLERADYATSFASGMAAISNSLFALLAPGKRLVVGKDTYGGASYLFTQALPKWGVNVTLVDTLDVIAFEQAMSKGCDLLYLETPSNPMLKIQDITLLSNMAHQQQGIVVIDNTLATAINQQPLTLGADVVIHSATKFLGGHADALGGVVCTNIELGEMIHSHKEIHGACLDPMSAYLIHRGMKTLALRMDKHNANALKLAEWLQQHPNIETVNYPGLASHDSHQLAKKQMSGYGGVLSFSLVNNTRTTQQIFSRFTQVVLASTLGSVETMLGTPSTTSHVECSLKERAALGIPETLIRCSVGIENIDTIIADFDHALSC